MGEPTNTVWERSALQIQKTVDRAERYPPVAFTYHAIIAEKEEGWHDGDTCHLYMQIDPDHWWGSPWAPLHCRIAGLQSPELKVNKQWNEAGLAARDYARSYLPPGSEVFVTVAGRDSFGRPLVVLKLRDGSLYANHMIMHGMGVVYRYASIKEEEMEEDIQPLDYKGPFVPAPE